MKKEENKLEKETKHEKKEMKTCSKMSKKHAK